MERDLQLLAKGTEEEKEAAAERLMAAGRTALPGLRSALQSANPDARWWAARALAGIDGPESAQMLLSVLADPDEDVRVCAILGLGERQDATAVDALLALCAEANAYVGPHIGDALSKIGEPAVPALVEALAAGPVAVRVQAARALVRIESQQAIPALVKALDDPEPTVEHYAWDALQRMGVGVTVFFQP